MQHHLHLNFLSVLYFVKKKIPKRDSFGLKFDELRGEREREREVVLGRQKKKKKRKDKKPALICGNYLERQ